jgi:hypothetical protein
VPKSCQTVFVLVQTSPDHVQGNLAPLRFLDFMDSSFGKQGTQLNLERVLTFRILVSEFSHRALVRGLIWGFLKIQMAKLSYYSLFVIWSISKFCIFPQVFSQFPFMCLNGPHRIM